MRSLRGQGWIVAAATVPVLVTLVLLLVTVWISATTGIPGASDLRYTAANYAEAYTDVETYQMLANTVVFGALVVLVALVFGLPMAWLAERTDLGHRELIYSLMTLGLLIPGFFTAMGWLLLLHPRIGIVSQGLTRLLGLPPGAVSVTNLGGMAWVQGLALAPLIFVMTSGTFRALNPQLDEAARVHGLGPGDTLRRVTLPLVLPSVVAAAVYTFTIAVAVFDVPAIIGLTNRILTFSTYIYLQTTSPTAGAPQYGIPAAASMSMVVLAGLLTWWYLATIRKAYRYQVVAGRGYAVTVLRLGRGRVLAWAFAIAYLLLAQGLPFLLMVWTSLMPYFQVPSAESVRLLTLANFSGLPWGTILAAAGNTLVLMLAVPTLVALAGLSLAWTVLRSPLRGRKAYDLVAFVAHAVPSMIFALGALVLALSPVGRTVGLYGSITLFVIVYTVVYLAFSARTVTTALLQIAPELEEAGFTSGMSLLAVLRHVLVPLLSRALASVWLWVALLAYRELTMAVVLFTPASVTLPLVIWSLWSSGGRLTQAAALNVLLIVVMWPLTLLYWFLSRRTGTRAA